MRDDQFALLVIILLLGFGGVICLLLPGGVTVLVWVAGAIGVVWSFWQLCKLAAWIGYKWDNSALGRKYFAWRYRDPITFETLEGQPRTREEAQEWQALFERRRRDEL